MSDFKRNFIIINDSIIDVDHIKAIQKRKDITDSYIIRITDITGTIFIEFFDKEEDRDAEFNRIIAVLNAR